MCLTGAVSAREAELLIEFRCVNDDDEFKCRIPTVKPHHYYKRGHTAGQRLKVCGRTFSRVPTVDARICPHMISSELLLNRRSGDYPQDDGACGWAQRTCKPNHEQLHNYTTRYYSLSHFNALQTWVVHPLSQKQGHAGRECSRDLESQPGVLAPIRAPHGKRTV